MTGRLWSKLNQANRADDRIQRFNRAKRVVDLGLLLVTAPVVIPLSLGIAVWMRFSQPGNVLFRQRRIGFNDVEFELLKFRTMSDVRNLSGELLGDADRITRVGRILRKTSLDELPQLINVARGEMSLIGPRPLFVSYAPFYTPRESMRHLVRPGITGMAQTSGRNNLKWDARLELDAMYVERASLRQDAVIAIKTVSQVVRQSNVTIVARESGFPLNVYRSFPTGSTCQLRLLTREDLPRRVQWMNDPSTREYMRLDNDISIESTQEWFEHRNRKSGKLDFAVEEVESKRLVAMVGLRDRSRTIAESYIFVDPELRGRGHGSEAQRLLLEWALGVGGYETVVSSVHESNLASRRVHERFGGRIVNTEDNRVEVWISAEDLR